MAPASEVTAAAAAAAAEVAPASEVTAAAAAAEVAPASAVMAASAAAAEVAPASGVTAAAAAAAEVAPASGVMAAAAAAAALVAASVFHPLMVRSAWTSASHPARQGMASGCKEMGGSDDPLGLTSLWRGPPRCTAGPSSSSAGALSRQHTPQPQTRNRARIRHPLREQH